MASEADEISPDLELITSVEPDAASEDTGGESAISATVGSTGALDRTEEDFTTNEKTRATGFMGKNSEVTWMQRLRQENKYGSPQGPGSEEEFMQRTGGASPLFERRKSNDSAVPLAEAQEDFRVYNSSYHLDDFAIATLDVVDPFELPTRDTAENLFNAYISRVHPSFPLIGKTTFTQQFRRFMAGDSPGEKWLAILNLIFAISAQYSHLIQAEWRGDERDHLIYFNRARILSMNGESIFQHPDLQQIQVSGLMSFYFLCTGQVNRYAFLGVPDLS